MKAELPECVKAQSSAGAETLALEALLAEKGYIKQINNLRSERLRLASENESLKRENEQLKKSLKSLMVWLASPPSPDIYTDGYNCLSTATCPP